MIFFPSEMSDVTKDAAFNVTATFVVSTWAGNYKGSISFLEGGDQMTWFIGESS